LGLDKFKFWLRLTRAMWSGRAGSRTRRKDFKGNIRQEEPLERTAPKRKKSRHGQGLTSSGGPRGKKTSAG